LDGFLLGESCCLSLLDAGVLLLFSKGAKIATDFFSGAVNCERSPGGVGELFDKAPADFPEVVVPADFPEVFVPAGCLEAILTTIGLLWFAPDFESPDFLWFAGVIDDMISL